MVEAMKKSPYLRRRPNSPYLQFRMRIPADVRQYFAGKSDAMAFTLGITDIAEASQRAIKFATAFQRIFDELRRSGRMPDEFCRSGPVLSAETLGELTQQVSAAIEHLILQEDERARTAGLEANDIVNAYRAEHPLVAGSAADIYRRVIDGCALAMTEAASKQDWHTIDYIFDRTLDRLQVQVDKESGEYQALKRAAFMAYQHGFGLQQARNAGCRVETPPLPACFRQDAERLGEPGLVSTTAERGARTAGTPSSGGPTLDDIYAGWKREKGHNPRTTQAVGKAFKRLAERVHVRFASELTKSMIADFKCHLLDHVSAVTAKRTLGLLNAAFNLAVSNGQIANNPCDKVKVSIPDNLEKARISFDADDLGRLFSNELFADKVLPAIANAGGIAAYWLPLIAVYSGARVGEIGQLVKENIRCPSGAKRIAYFMFNNEDGRHTKNRFSNREVPIHPELIRLGLLDYVARLPKGARLFPLLKPNKYGDLTGGFSKWFGKFLRKEIGIADKRKVFHSFRHTFISACKASRMPLSVRYAIVGHSEGTVDGNYGEVTLETMFKYLKSLKIDGMPF